jgi:hypothetical protein
MLGWLMAPTHWQVVGVPVPSTQVCMTPTEMQLLFGAVQKVPKLVQQG